MSAAGATTKEENKSSSLNSTRSTSLDHMQAREQAELEAAEEKKREHELARDEILGEKRLAQIKYSQEIIEEAAKRSSQGANEEEKDTLALEYIETTLEQEAQDHDGSLDRLALSAHIDGKLRSRNILAVLLDGRKAPTAQPKSNVPAQQPVPVKPAAPRPLHNSPILRSALLRVLAEPYGHTYHPASSHPNVLLELGVNPMMSKQYYPTIYDSFLKCVRSWQPKPLNAESDAFLINLLTSLLKAESFSMGGVFFPLTQLAELIFIDKANRERYMRYYTLVMTVGVRSKYQKVRIKNDTHFMNYNLAQLMNSPTKNKYKFNNVHIIFKTYQIDALIDWLLLIPFGVIREMDLKGLTTFVNDHQKTLFLDAEYTASKKTTSIGGYKITLIQRLCGYILLALFEWQKNHPSKESAYAQYPSAYDIKQTAAKTPLVIDAQCHVTLPLLKEDSSFHEFLKKMREYVEKNKVKLEFTPYEPIVPVSPEAAALLALSDASPSSSSSSSSSAVAASSSAASSSSS